MTVIRVGETTIIRSQIQGPAGPPGTELDVSVTSIPISYGQPSPLAVKTLTTGKILLTAELVMDIAFDGTAPTASLGTIGSPALFFSTTQLDLKSLQTFQVNPNYRTVGQTVLYFYLTPDINTTVGAGNLLLYIKE